MPAVTLQGEFVDLIPLTPSHAALTFAWRQSERATNLNRGAATVEQQAAWIGARPATEYNFLICLKDGRPVGMVAISAIDTVNRHAEPGRFLIGEPDAVRGIPAAVEAMKLIYQLVFEQLQLERVFGTIASDNLLMVKWQKFLGMKEEGRLRRHYFINGHFQDALCFGMLEAEYRAAALPRMNALIMAGRSRSNSPS
ncbi:GNAT family N-acetyltransferase [Paucibacter sp. B2R-40]|uniref:GNAT family N-acetyltransferase n=1 Tax=Paucibacter sp. B2R-40 TaxID=2893554 RepID=UPI0021E3C128|nr:GNAT family N-acetyltransferase [Paucibacter sp. B2R-40]MCV2357241.1 GNAT family N-acetyltransferase [Paucibacter sp. B2R-40]